MTSPIETYFELGMAHFEARDYAHAVDMFTKALRLSLGDLAETYLYRGNSYAFLGAYDKAMDDFNEALRHNPYLADAYNERGNLLRMQAAYEEAIQDYDAAVTIDSAHYAVYYNRALAYEKIGQYVKAESDLTQAIELNPSIAPSYEMRGQLRAMMQNYDGAIADLKRYLRMGGGHEYDNHSEIQSFIINLRINKFLSRFVPHRFLIGNRLEP
ncbi:MAG: tetratricopeptide repeat protein [Anaerolineae bacterium]|nr:tetratricopeptide repeat protein [Anaerolineae bacterium]